MCPTRRASRWIGGCSRSRSACRSPRALSRVFCPLCCPRGRTSTACYGPGIAARLACTGRWTRRILVSGEVALALVLVICAFLLVKSLAGLLATQSRLRSGAGPDDEGRAAGGEVRQHPACDGPCSSRSRWKSASPPCRAFGRPPWPCCCRCNWTPTWCSRWRGGTCRPQRRASAGRSLPFEQPGLLRRAADPAAKGPPVHRARPGGLAASRGDQPGGSRSVLAGCRSDRAARHAWAAVAAGSGRFNPP